MNLETQFLAKMRFACIFLVVWVHAYNLGGIFLIESKTLDRSAFHFFELFFSHGMAFGATSALFAISGYLYSRPSRSSFEKVKERVLSLAIPFLLWNGVTWGIVFLLTKQDRIYLPEFYAPLLFRPIWDQISAPIDYPLWFIFDLLIVSLTAPLLKILIDRFPRGTLFGILMIPFLHHFSIFNSYLLESFLFYGIGMFLYDRKLKLPSFKAWVTLWIASSLLKAGLHFILDTPYTLDLLVARLCQVSAIFAILGAPWERLFKSRRFHSFFGASFIIFAAQVPLVDLLKANIPLLPQTNYFFVPVLLIFVLTGFDRLLRKAPILHDWLTGYRSR